LVSVSLLQLEVLKRKSFLEDLGDGSTIIGMHDLWREFSVMETRVGEYNQRRWVYDVHGPHFRPEESSLGDSGWRSLQRICSKGSASNSVIEVNLTDCSNTKVLKLIDLQLDESVLDLKALKRLKSLEFLSRRGTWVPQIEVLGLQFLTNLVVLKLDNIPTNSICVEEIAILTNLQILQLHSGIENTNKLPDLEDLILLQMVTFCFGNGAETISGLSSWMTNLQYLDLGWCGFLRSCHGVGELVALEELELCYCEKLEELPDLQRLTNLKKLNIIGCKFLKALPGLGDLVALRVLRAKFCKKLAELPDMHKLTNLQVLDIRYVKLRHVPGLTDRLDLHKLMELQTVEIRGWGSQGLPCVLRLANVKSLTIWNCTGVAELAGLSNSSGLQALSVGFCDFKDVSGLSRLTALQSLTIQQCNELESLPDLRQLLKLEMLDIRACHRLRDWSRETPGPDLLCAGTLPQLETLKCSYLPITELPDLSNFPRLKELDLDHCGGLLSLSSSEPLMALEVLMLSSCRNLKTLPDLSCSKRLLYFKLLYCGVRVNTQEIEKLRAMCSRLVFRSAESEI
jgi:Leucine-rich repeat (LRR) protein